MGGREAGALTLKCTFTSELGKIQDIIAPANWMSLKGFHHRDS